MRSRRDSRYHNDRWSCCIIVRAPSESEFHRCYLLYFSPFCRDLGSQIKRKLEQDWKDDDRRNTPVGWFTFTKRHVGLNFNVITDPRNPVWKDVDAAMAGTKYLSKLCGFLKKKIHARQDSRISLIISQLCRFCYFSRQKKSVILRWNAKKLLSGVRRSKTLSRRDSSIFPLNDNSSASRGETCTYISKVRRYVLGRSSKQLCTIGFHVVCSASRVIRQGE